MIRGAAEILLVALILAGCAATIPPETASNRPRVAVPEAARPYGAGQILDAMRASRRPGGVPDALETRQVAAQVADAIWTIDGRPWPTISTSGTCAADRCTLEISGSRPGTLGEDVWIFAIQPGGDGSASVVEASLGGVPAVLAAEADEVARRSELGTDLEGLVVASATWHPPPDEAVLLLAYRAGDEEGSCRRDVRVDLSSGETAVEESVDC